MNGTLLIPSASNYVGLSSLRFFIRTRRKRRERDTTKQASARLAPRDCPIRRRPLVSSVRAFLPWIFRCLFISYSISRDNVVRFTVPRNGLAIASSPRVSGNSFTIARDFPFLHNKTAKRRLVEFLFRFRDGTSREVLTTKFL